MKPLDAIKSPTTTAGTTSKPILYYAIVASLLVLLSSQPNILASATDCSTPICQNNATCIDRPGQFYCDCPPGKTGLLCQLDDGCYSKPCHPHATCDVSPVDGHAECICPAGFTGRDCSIDIDECAAGSPCEHGGICVNTPGSFKCECSKGFDGTRCEININECDTNPCSNGGTCLDEKGGYKCICMPGFAGQNCNIDIDECALNPCENGATCKDMINSYRCLCQTGFWGQRCELSVNSTNNQADEGLIDISPCPVGWEGKNCSDDVDECALKNRCKNDGVCTNYPGSYRCDCPDEFTGPNCERLKTPCENKPCKNNAICNDSLADGGYTCECPEGFYGRHCDSDTCLVRPCTNNGTCVKIFNKNICFCPPGFSGPRCETRTLVSWQQEVSLNPPPNLKTVSSCSKCKNGARCGLLHSGQALCLCNTGYSGPDCSVLEIQVEEEGCPRECEAKRNNGKCDAECNVTSCQLDGGDCFLGVGNPWAKCSNPLACWKAFKDGKCDKECNTAECLYDGQDCAQASHDTNSKNTHPASPSETKICEDKSDTCLKNYANGVCDPQCNTAACGWDGADCEVPSGPGDIAANTEARGSLIIRVEPAINLGSPDAPQTSIETQTNIEMARLIRQVSVLTSTILKIGSLQQVENGTEIILTADNRKCQSSCYNSTELIAKFLNALRSRTRDLDRYEQPQGLQITDIKSSMDHIGPSDASHGPMPAFFVLVIFVLGTFSIIIVVSKGNKQKIKEKTITWFPEGYMKPVSRKKDPTDRKSGRGVSTLQAMSGKFFRGIKRNERNISSNPSGFHSTDVDRCGAATPNGGAIYHEPTYDQYDDYNGTYAGTDTGSVMMNGDEPMTPSPAAVDPFNMEGPFGQTPLMLAAMGAVTSKDPLGLVAYGTTGELDASAANKVSDLLLRGAQLNVAHKITGETPLHLAARHGRADTARSLLEKCNSQDVNAQDATGRTPLHAAIAADSLGVFEILTKNRNTDLNAQTHDGTTPLILAARVGSYSMLEGLIQSECEVTKSDKGGRTALHWAAATNNVDAIRRLLESRETNKDAQDNAEETPLFLAAKEGAKGAVEILLSYNANKDICDQMDKSPIDIARERQHYDIVIMLEQHAPPTPRSVRQDLPLTPRSVRQDLPPTPRSARQDQPPTPRPVRSDLPPTPRSANTNTEICIGSNPMSSPISPPTDSNNNNGSLAVQAPTNYQTQAFHYNVPCLKNYMTPSPDSPYSVDCMASPPGTYTGHPNLPNQNQAGVYI